MCVWTVCFAMCTAASSIPIMSFVLRRFSNRFAVDKQLLWFAGWAQLVLASQANVAMLWFSPSLSDAADGVAADRSSQGHVAEVWVPKQRIHLHLRPSMKVASK